MKRLAIYITAVLLGSFVLSNQAMAQQPFSNTQSSPTTSPYLTLTNRNGGANGFAAYQNYVVPQIQQQQINQQQQQQLQHLQQSQQKSLTGGPVTRGISSQIRGTGHITAFMDTSHYFTRYNGSGQAQAPRQ